MFLETVMSKSGRVHSYRFWLPLSTDQATQFITEACGNLVEWDNSTRTIEIQPTKKQKTEDLSGMVSSLALPTKYDVLRAMRIYRGAEAVPSIATDPITLTGSYTDNHIISLLCAKTQMLRMNASGATCNVIDSQRIFERYYGTDEDICTNYFSPPETIVHKKLIREIRPGFLLRGNDLLNYYLPTVVPSTNQIGSVFASMNHATGQEFNVDDINRVDPTLVSSIPIEKEHNDSDCLEQILSEVYPIMHRVKLNTRKRLASGEPPSEVCNDLVTELRTLFSVKARTLGLPPP